MNNKNHILFLGVIMLLCFFSVSLDVLAAVTVTPATGGSAISSDTTGGAYTSLTGPIISEGATADIGAGGGSLPATIILNIPSGFIFDTGGTAPTVLVTRTAGNGGNQRNINGLASGSTIAVTVTTTTLTITISSVTQNGVTNSLTWQNIGVRPSSGTPLASGNITESGTLSITGVTGSTNFGTLTEVVGAKSQVIITTQPSTNATAATDFGTKPVVAVRDQFGNTVTSDNSSTITRTAVLSTQSCGGTAGSGTITSTPASGAAVTAGVMTYTAMQYSAAESIKICFSSAGVTSALSNTVTVSAASTSTPTPTPPSTPTPTPVAEEPPVIKVGGGTAPALIIFSGKAFPGATLGVYLMGEKYGQVLIDNEFKTQNDGSFEKEIHAPVEERRLYGLLIKDKDGKPTKSKFFTYNIMLGTTIYQGNLIFAPTIKINKPAFVRNEFLLVSGDAAPGNTVEALADGKVIGNARIDDAGLYKIFISTNDLVLKIYNIQTRQVDSASGKTSDVSETKIIRVGSFSFANIDFDQDGQINVSDWSIFLSNWSSSDKSIHVRDDLNGDGKVDVSDFSVFLVSFQLSQGH